MMTKSIYKEFQEYIGSKQQVREISIISAIILIMGVVMRIVYPYPFSFPDSGAYVLTAFDGTYNVYRPMGYSTYIAFLHNFSSGTGFLFWATYLLNATSTLLLIYSVKFLLKIRRHWLFLLFAGCAIFAPRLIFSANFLMSDSLFCSLTMLFLTSALWLIYNRSWVVTVVHLLIFIALFKVRYSGMFFLPVSMLSVYLSFNVEGRHLRSATISLIPLLIFGFLYGSTLKEYRETTGVDTFSGFAGWQMVNNASVLLPMAKQIPADDFQSDEMKLLHSFVCYMPDSLYSQNRAMMTDYMWNKNLTYKQFLFYKMQVTGRDYTSLWVETGKLYAEYAAQLIRHYPLDYLTRFVVPSLCSNFECGDIAEERSEFVNEPMYAQYFGTEGDRYPHSGRVFTNLFPVRKVMNVVFWSALLLSIVYFAATTRKKSFTQKQWQLSAMILFLILIFTATQSIASPNTTWRYTMPIFLPSLAFIFYNVSAFLDRISKKA